MFNVYHTSRNSTWPWNCGRGCSGNRSQLLFHLSIVVWRHSDVDARRHNLRISSQLCQVVTCLCSSACAHAFVHAFVMVQKVMLTPELAYVCLHLCTEGGQPCDTAGGHICLSRVLRV